MQTSSRAPPPTSMFLNVSLLLIDESELSASAVSYYNLSKKAVCRESSLASSGEFGSQHFHFLDHGSHCEKVRRVFHQSFRDGAVHMSLAPGFVGERIEYSERGGPETQREPQRRRGFLVGEFETFFQKGGEFVFLAGFCLKTNIQSKLKHVRSPA